jgi:leucyl aminopeptidase
MATMTAITISKKTLTAQPKKYVRLMLTEDAPSHHRLVERHDGILEYRMGAGKFKELTPRKFITLVRSVVQAAKAHQITHLALSLDPDAFPKVIGAYSREWCFSTLAENLAIASYEFTAYKSGKEKKQKLAEICVCGSLTAAEKKAFARGMTVGTYVNLSRDISNATAADLTPTALASRAKEHAKGLPVKVRILGEKELQKLKMNLILAVGQGSLNESKLIAIEYWGRGEGKKKDPIVFVGKGITYDTGGLNLKPSGYMHDMHMDMSGGASVIAATLCAAKLGLKKNIVALIPAAENAISDRAMRPGDIITSYSGKTVEVLNTDAEGRMVLADALTYAKRYDPALVLDIATLTGAALVALGQHASAYMTKDRDLEESLRALGEESGDYLWPLPLWEEYQQYLKSSRADLSNIATTFSRYGGAIEGGTFLSFFAPECPWAHIDIAPRMESIGSDKLAKGSTGEPVRLLIRLAEKF